MDLDPNHKVIVPTCTTEGINRIMRIENVPGFRVHCANPATIAPGEANQVLDQSESGLDAG
jgi:hypothetical protein